MIRLTYSNRTEQLAAALAERVAERADPFVPITIVVPNRAMERWLERELAARLGIAANLRFARLEALVRDELRARGAGEVIEPAAIEGRLLAILLDPSGRVSDPELETVRQYLGGAGADEEAIELRAVQLARRMARLFQEYGFSRGAMLDAWSRGELALAHTPSAATERWQRALFERARAGREERTLGEAIRALRQAPRTPEAPRTVHVFGVSYVARAFQEAIAALGARFELHLYALNPCREFWEDAISDAEARRARRASAVRDDDPLALAAENESAILRAWGRPGREHVALLDELGGFDPDARFEAPSGSTLLARVQRSILDRTMVEPGHADRSLRVIAAPSIRREIETVAAEIWSIVDRSHATARPLRFHEIAILINGPDRDRYLPHLEAVLAESHDLPWNAVDLALASRSRVADCAMRLLDLPGSAFSRAELLEILAHPLVLARWPEADPARVGALSERLGVFHGIDGRDHAQTYLAGTDLVHWDQAVRRLALGAICEGERSGRQAPISLGSLALFPEEIALGDDLATGLGLLVRSLAADARAARAARMRPPAWAELFAALLRSYLVPTEPAEEAELARCIGALERIGARDAGAPIGWRVAAELARGELEALPASRGEPFGDGVVVASLLPMRAIPFRVVFVLGLGEGSFPARELETGLDLRAALRQPGDVAIDERDRYTMLETLLCAREELVLSYVARHERTGETREPSSIIHALEEAIAAAGGAPMLRAEPPLRRREIPTSTDDAILAHALPAAAIEARARQAGAPHRRALAGARFPEAALARLAPDDPRRALLAMPAIPRPAREGDRPRLAIAQIRRFLECPIQGHAEGVLGRIEEGADRGAVDEPFEIARAERERLLAASFVASIGGDEGALDRSYREHVARAAARGRWPLGVLARIRERDDREDLARWRRALAKFLPSEGEVHRIRFGGASIESIDRVRDRPRDPLPLPRAGRAPIEIVGATRWRIGGDALFTTTRSLEGEGERARVEILEHALRAFVDHAVLSLAGLAGASSRRAWILDGSEEPPIAIQLAPMRPSVAERWLSAIAEDLECGPHGFFLPCQAILRVEHLFSRGGAEPGAELARSIEEVRTKWRGGSSQWGPVRDAIEHPAPEGALALARRRFGAFFDHLRAVRRLA